MFRTLYKLLAEQNFRQHPDSERFNDFLYCLNFFYAEPGGPPLREYKQPMAKHEASPHPGPVKRKLNKGG